MITSTLSSRQEHRLFQLGLLLFLLALLIGLAVPLFAVPRLGLSTHLLGILQGIFLVVLGLLWPKLTLSRTGSSLAFWLAIYGCFAAWAANLLAAIWGAGNTMLPIAAGRAHGTILQERLISVGLRTAALSLIMLLLLLLWGVRAVALEQPEQ
jgi:(hydroxyamino)benzene mutase